MELPPESKSSFIRRINSTTAIVFGSGEMAGQAILMSNHPFGGKQRWMKPEMARSGGDDLPFVFSGTLVVRGEM